jgi:hypothetical protein
MKIETVLGTLTAEVVAHERRVELDPSGFRWIVEDEEVGTLIYVLENRRNHVFFRGRSMVYLQWVNESTLEIIAQDILDTPRHLGTRTHVTASGVFALLGVLESAGND